MVDNMIQPDKGENSQANMEENASTIINQYVHAKCSVTIENEIHNTEAKKNR